jgi:anti-sigma factor (TIGR02949 family)
MTCEEVFRALNDYLDRELDPEETRRFQAHLATCVTCALEHRFEATVLDGIREKVQSFEVPSDLLAKVFRRLAQASDPPAKD